MEAVIIDYNKAINVLTFERYNTDKNYLDLISSWRENEIKLANDSINKFQVLTQDFVLLLNDLAEKTFELFSAAIRIKEGNKRALNTFNNRLTHIESSLVEMRLMSEVITVNVQKQQINEANFMHSMFLNLIDKFYGLLNVMGIKLIDSPIYLNFKKARRFIKRKSIYKTEENFQLTRTKKPVEENIWFKVGLKFATGEAQNLLESYRTGKGQFVKGHYTKITEKLGFKKTDKVYFSQTFNNTSKDDNKNIYSQPEKILQIYEYCQSRNIKVVDDFKKHLQSNSY